MNTQTFFCKATSFALIVSFCVSPLSALAQEAEVPAVAPESAVTQEVAPAVETPAVETPSSNPDSTPSSDEAPADVSPTVEEELSPDTDKTEEPEPTDEPPPPNGLLDARDSPYEDQRHPVHTKLQINADEPTGALALSFPINVPPGRNGLEPTLSVKYNSQSHEEIHAPFW
jgi:hypothetical protein